MQECPLERLLRPMDDSAAVRDQQIIRLVTYLMYRHPMSLKRIVKDTGLDNALELLQEYPDLFQETVHRKAVCFRLFYHTPRKTA